MFTATWLPATCVVTLECMIALGGVVVLSVVVLSMVALGGVFVLSVVALSMVALGGVFVLSVDAFGAHVDVAAN